MRLGGEGQISEVHAVPIFLIIVGIIVFLVGLMGCCGALVLDAFMLKAVISLIPFHCFSLVRVQPRGNAYFGDYRGHIGPNFSK